MHAQITASNSTFSKLNNNQYTYNNSKQPMGDYQKKKYEKWKMHKGTLVTCIHKWPIFDVHSDLTVLYKLTDKIYPSLHEFNALKEK